MREYSQQNTAELVQFHEIELCRNVEVTDQFKYTMQAGDTFLSWLLTTLALLYKECIKPCRPYTGYSRVYCPCQGSDDTDVTKKAVKGVSSPPRPFTVLVEGNVGSGKSSFLDIMESWQGVSVLQEPVETWRNAGGQNLFNDMQRDPKRWMKTFQLFSTMTRLTTSPSQMTDLTPDSGPFRVRRRLCLPPQS